MLSLLGVPVIIAYHIVSALANGLAPLLGGAAAVAAIVACTAAARLLLLPLTVSAMRGQAAQARLAPQVADLRRRHRDDPRRLHAEVTALYRREGTSMLAGYLPVLLQAPFFAVLYLLFRSPRIGGTANGLLHHHLLSASLASHWLTAPGPVSAQGAVFLGVFCALAVIGWLQARQMRQPPAPVPPAAGTTAGQRAGAARVLALLAPAITVAMAAVVPLAAGLYLVTTTAWTLAERAVLRRRIGPPAPVSPPGKPGKRRRTTGRRR